MKLLLLLVSLYSCQDYNVNSFDASRYGGPSKDGVQKVIQNRCINCHMGTHNNWADFNDEDWIRVGYVIPGDPENSPFIKSIINAGGNMPYLGEALPNNDYQMLWDWILNLE